MRKLLTAAEERDLIQKAQAGDRAARDRVLLANQGLVWSIARRHASLGVEPDDLAQAGNIGLMRAVEKFDTSRGLRFTTYATFWIRMEIKKSRRATLHLVTVPGSLADTVRGLNRKLRKGEPVHIPPRNAHTLRALAAAHAPHVSLDAAWYRTRTPDPTAGLRCAEVLAALDDLPDRPRRMLSLRFGLLGGECWNLEDIGRAFGVCKERARQIEAEALEKLRCRLGG